MFYKTTYPSPIGLMTLACDETSLVGLWFENQKYFGGTISQAMSEKGDFPIFDVTKKWLDRYFGGGKPAISELPVEPTGGDFRQVVWGILCEIPYGEVTTYGEIARKAAAKMGRERMSGQATGGAVGHNPISIIIPCHRVVGANGSLTGYAGGLDKKIKLLRHEGVDVDRLFVPTHGTAL